MEPEDLLRTGDSGAPGGGGSAGADELRAIVARASRRRWRAAAGALAVALVAGGGVGYAVSNHGGAQTVVAGSGTNGSGNSSAAAAPTVGAADGLSASGTAVGGLVQSMTHLFNRTAGAVTIRGYLTNFKSPAGIEMPSCVAFGGTRFQAEVSTDKMVATLGGSPYQPAASGAVKSGMSEIVGVAESDPTALVVVETSASVAKVSMQFVGGGSDEMIPVQGWSALAAPAAAPPQAGKVQAANGIAQVKVGTLKAFGSSGQLLQRVEVFPGSIGSPPSVNSACGGTVCPLKSNTSQSAPTFACGTCSSTSGGTLSGGGVTGSGVSSGAVSGGYATGSSSAASPPATTTGPSKESASTAVGVPCVVPPIGQGVPPLGAPNPGPAQTTLVPAK